MLIGLCVWKLQLTYYLGAGIGLTPCMSILTALTKYDLSIVCTYLHRYRWRKNFTPEILHFYWVVRHSEIESFQWIVHALAGKFFFVGP